MILITSFLLTTLIGQACPDGSCSRPLAPPPQVQMAVVEQWNYYDVTASDGVTWRVWGRPRRELGKMTWDIEWHAESQPAGFPKRIDAPVVADRGQPTRPAGPANKPGVVKPGVDMSHAKEGVRSNLPDADLVDLLTPPGGSPPDILPESVVMTATMTGTGIGGFLDRLNPFKRHKVDAETPAASGLFALIGFAIILLAWAIRSAGDNEHGAD